MITLQFYQKDKDLIFECEDDGTGLVIEKIKAKALEKKIVTPEKLASMKPEEIYELIYTPGFSTA